MRNEETREKQRAKRKLNLTEKCNIISKQK